MSYKTIILLLLFLIFQIHSYAQKSLDSAEYYLKHKYAEIKDGYATSTNINKAIYHFKQIKTEPERTIGLLKSYEFKASWTDCSQKEKKQIYKMAIDLAEEKTKEFPENGAIVYWYAANYARWANMLDIVEAAQNNVLNEIKKLSQKAIKLDENYNQAGAIRLLGGMYLEVPNIPLILEWPSDKKAQKLLKKAYKIAPEHPANQFLYAKTLHKNDKNKEAEILFKDLIEKKSRKEYYLVDEKYINKGKDYFNNNFKVE